MTTPKSNDEEDASAPQASQTSSPDKTSTPDAGTASSTPARKAERPNGGVKRRRASTTKQPPTLLGDFLLGRPSPARLAAEKQAALERKKELDAVKQEMRQAAVMRVQAPGGVRDRVNKWQKANAEAMANADPYAPPTEPSEVHVQVDEESVTEQDRERIKWRQKKPAQQKVVAVKQRQGQAPASPDKTKETRPNNPPKKRVVSDTNWVKNAKKNTPQPKSQPTKPKQNAGGGQPLPKNFLQRPAANPSVAKKVQAWASKVEIPDDPPKRHIASRSVGSTEGFRSKNIGAESDTRSSKSESARIVVEEERDAKKSEAKKPRPGNEQDDGIRVKPMRKKIYETDGIRVRPQKPSSPPDDGIRVYASTQGSQLSLPDDGIRVYASSQGSRSTSTVRAPSRKPSKRKAPARAASFRRAHTDSPPSDRIEVIEDPESEVLETPTRRPSRRVSNPRRTRRKKPAPRSVSDRHTMVTGTTDTGTTVTGTTQTGTSATGTRPTGSSVTGTTQTGTEVTCTTQTGTTVTEDVSDSASWTSSSSSSSAEESDEQSTALPSRLADIPVGYSAFSVLDLPSDNKGQNSRRPKATRQASFKGATNVLKKVLTEGKKMMTEKVEPPKPVTNQPPNIENWLKGTVDPFVEGPPKGEAETHHRKSTEKEWVEQSKARQPTPPTSKPTAKPGPVEPKPSPVPSPAEKSREYIQPEEPKKNLTEETRSEERELSSISSNSLKRSRATRISSYPLRPSAKRGFKDKLRDAFRGESTGHSYMPPPEYPSCSTIVDLDDDPDDEYWDERHSSETPRGLPHSDDEESVVSSEPPKQQPQPMQQKRRPPTNGHHELSTIVSESSRSTRETDMSSVVSTSTVTETTAFSRSTRTGTEVARKRSQKSGLKRRLTKHSDLISVLSLPDDETVPKRGNSLRSARSVRRASNNLGNATVESLLREFAGDENLYQRELKTLVDGVVPVLLTQVIHGEGNGPKDLFGSPAAKPRRDMLSKAVVDMGVALEKLRNHHKRCPLLDVHRLPHWLESVHTVYDRYLDVWRLGFQGVIVNLAPAALDDDSSLVNAMPRNEDGDVLNEDGERIDVAHLLKRPLVRVKWITKFIKGYRAVTGTENYENLAAKWECLQEKARRRHKEETARAVDDDARYTDTSRARDLETLEELDNVKIDRYRQVYAKDTFSLDLRHSNGQRLVCQIELISRDNPVFKSDPGDLLIREIGSGGRSWLLFAPISGGDYSARKGDDAYQLVVMIRGYKDEWYELLTLAADDKEQILDWLDILGTHPVPPAIKRGVSVRRPHTSVSSSKSTALDTPLGGRRSSQRHTAAPPPLRPAEISKAKSPSPDRLHMRTASLPVTPTANSVPAAPSLSPETTPTQKSERGSQPPPPAYPPPFIPAPSSPPPAIPPPSSPPPAPPAQDNDEEDLRPEPLRLRKSSPSSTPNSTPFREDGAPPPPVHRTFSQKSPNLAPPQEKSSGRLKRRTSSPLKHEYHPSDISTDASSSMSGTEDDYDDYDDQDRLDDYDDEYSVSSESSDELEAADIPDTVPAISVKQPEWTHNQSLVSDSVDSLTPSASASQAELSKANDNTAQSYVFKSLASVSYWDNKHGCWKDLWPDVCQIVTTPGLIEAYPFQRIPTSSGNSPKSEDRPLIALDLTPLVMLRNSTALDLEIRSPVLSYARLYPKINKVETSFFRFRASSFQECESLYLGVHRARMDNAKYKALEEETRIRSFGQQQAPSEDGDATSSRRRSWFGRKNSYRASARAPSQSAGSLSSTMSATSFLKRLMGGHQSFNIAMSSIDRPQSSRPGSVGGDPSFYSSHSSPRSPSVSLAHSGGMANHPLTTNNLKIRLHLLVSASKWEDHGNCLLEVTRPDAGARQNLRKYQGMEKRVIVHTLNKKHPEKEKLVLDVVLGSRCFSRLGSRGVLLNVWEETAGVGEGDGPRDRGNSGGLVSKWCFQCASVAEAAWIYGLVTQEVMIG